MDEPDRSGRPDGSGQPSTPPSTGAAAHGATDRVQTLRERLDGIADVPVAERVALFEDANAVLADELAALDEV